MTSKEKLSLFSENGNDTSANKGVDMPSVKDEYIYKIVGLLHECNDVTLLDLMLQLLEKSK